jgi:hypothetical protein
MLRCRRTLDLGLHIVDGVGRLHLKGDSLTRKGFDENLHDDLGGGQYLRMNFVCEVPRRTSISPGAYLFDQCAEVWCGRNVRGAHCEISSAGALATVTSGTNMHVSGSNLLLT